MAYHMISPGTMLLLWLAVVVLVIGGFAFPLIWLPAAVLFIVGVLLTLRWHLRRRAR